MDKHSLLLLCVLNRNFTSDESEYLIADDIDNSLP